MQRQENPLITTGVIHNSRSSSNYLLSLSKDGLNSYVNTVIAALHSALLKPYIRIISHDEKFKEIHYEIDVLSKNGELHTIKGVTKNSSKNANFIAYYMRNKPDQQLDYIRNEIASHNKKRLIPLIVINSHGRYYRKIKYTIDMTALNAQSVMHQSKKGVIVDG